MNITDTTKMLDRSNIAEMPNPKGLSVERVSVSMEHTDDKGTTSYGPEERGFVRNASIHPEAVIGRR
jgi:hypothetical protein